MPIPKPNLPTGCDTIHPHPLEPCIAEWADSNQNIPFHNVYKRVLVQVVNVIYGYGFGYYVTIRDGLHQIDAKVNEKLNRFFDNLDMHCLDIIEIKKSSGSNQHLFLQLVSVFGFNILFDY